MNTNPSHRRPESASDAHLLPTPISHDHVSQLDLVSGRAALLDEITRLPVNESSELRSANRRKWTVVAPGIAAAAAVIVIVPLSLALGQGDDGEGVASSRDDRSASEVTPSVAAPPPLGYEINGNGQSYGGPGSLEDGSDPDLVFSSGDHNRAGYLRRSDQELLTGTRAPITDAEIAEFITQYPSGRIQVPLLAADGETRVDTFTVQFVTLPDSESSAPEYPVNASGQTYGTVYSDLSLHYPPDLMAVVGESGRSGYVVYADFEIGSAPPGGLPVYLSDGQTVVDSFPLGS